MEDLRKLLLRRTVTIITSSSVGGASRSKTTLELPKPPMLRVRTLGAALKILGFRCAARALLPLAASWLAFVVGDWEPLLEKLSLRLLESIVVLLSVVTSIKVWGGCGNGIDWVRFFAK